MADGLNRAFIRVHQALHGYADGHRLLACSTTLKPRDQKTMLIMSDVSGPNAAIGEAGYFTGYPLAESGAYALACTWAAREMARPGCVWTHTLLFDFADLAVLPSMGFLVSAFRRPTAGFSSTSFESAIGIKYPVHEEETKEPNGDALKRVLWALYGHPRERIIASSEETSPESLFLVWAQQWPRLRRMFRFCTLAFGDRSSDGSPFDLQLVPTRERSVRSRFSGTTDADRLRPGLESWMDVALNDLLEGPRGSLRAFLRDVGGDLASGRDAFVPLCRLHQLMPQFEGREAAIDEAVELLDSSFDPAAANSLRTMFVTAIAAQPAAMGERSLKFVLDHLDLLDTRDLDRAAMMLAHTLWTHQPESLVSLLHDPPPRQLIGQRGLAELAVNDLVQGLQRSPQVIPAVLEVRPELCEVPDLWRISGSWSDLAFSIASKRPERAEVVLTAALSAERSDLAYRAVDSFGAATVLRMICKWGSEQTIKSHVQTLSAWIAAAARNGEAVAEVLSGGCEPEPLLLLQIARATYPDLVPNNFGEDPWWTGVHRSKGTLDDTQRQYLAAFLLARAFGYRSRNQAELIGYAFDDVYIPAAESRLSREAWNVVEPRLPKPWFVDWDYCQRIRDALVDAFVERDLSASAFVRVTRDDYVFEQLARLAARTGRGRRFLKKALQAITDQNQWARRAEVLQDAI